MEYAIKFPIWFILIALYGDLIHRFGYHRVAWLWKFHEVHHRNYAFHFHPVEMFINWGLPFIVSVPFMGLPFCLIALAAVIFESRRGHGELKSVRVPKAVYKGFGWVTRGYHKQHHINPNVAYGQITVWLDWLFGTMPEKKVVI